jgi:hypothetical protein
MVITYEQMKQIQEQDRKAWSNSHFRRNGKVSPIYNCKICKKATRETGMDESSANLCKSCYLECLEENRRINE